MTDSDDPEMKEIVKGFLQETRGLITEMEEILEQFEEDPDDKALLEHFGQKIDRIMGTAETLEFEMIGKICKMGKLIGYKASQNNDVNLNLIVSGILSDCLLLLSGLADALEKNQPEPKQQIDAFLSRLKWLTEKFKHIDRSSLVQKKAK